MVAMELDVDLLQEQKQRNLPRLIEASYLLNLSSQELEAVIAAELQDNPALEIEDTTLCPRCGSALEGGYCATCLTELPATPPADPDEEMFERIETIREPRSQDDEFDPVLSIASDMDVPGQLLADARTILPPRDYALAEMIIDALDERGFLTVDVAEVAAATQRPLEDIERVLATLQAIAPAGVAARDLRESLLLQLAYLKEMGIEVPELVERIIEDHLTELGNHRYQQIARRLRVTPEAVGEAHAFIQEHLSPHPLQNQHWKTWQSPATTPYVTPDVIISIVDGEFRIEVTGTSRGDLRVNPLYDELAQRLRRRGGTGSAAGDPSFLGPTSDQDREHIREAVARAKQFIGKIRQRRETLLKISTCICELQEDFLREGVRELRPLTRSQVAQHIGVHESTVSRATANKYVMLPNRKVIPFSDFFTPSLSVKDVIREIIETESRNGRPLSDMRIRELLAHRGYRIARRTVAKYRAELKILPSTVR
ncbi:MAG: RNA polymerase sigma-54 factor [Chloroflexota bacterium]